MSCSRFERDKCTPECSKWLACSVVKAEREAPTAVDDPDKHKWP